jgi:uncharacterized protein GlcG (DUF336 family)
MIAAGEAVVHPRRSRPSHWTVSGWLAAGALVSAVILAAQAPQAPQTGGQAADRVSPASHHRRPPAHHSGPPPLCAGGQPALSSAEVTALAQGAAGALDAATMTVAVVDRIGNVLGLFRKTGASSANDDLAIGLARTGAFFSNDQAPLSSRTVRFISGIHFPPGIANTPNAPLYGIEATNRGCNLGVAFSQPVPPAGSLAGGLCKGAAHLAGCGTGPVTGKVDLSDSDESAVDPGGLPLFRGGAAVVGGIGVAGVPPEQAEFAAFTGAANTGFLPAPAPPGVVFIGGIRLPFVVQTQRPAGTNPEPPPVAGALAFPPLTGGCAPEGYLAGPLPGSQLSLPEVSQIVQQAIAGASRTRAQIRLPLGSRTRMVIAVSDLDGTILALYRMPDATVFSIDVAVAKSRNVVYFSGGSPLAQLDLPGVPPGTAVTNRTIGFGAQPLYPPGIDGSGPGPFFDLLQRDAANPCTQGFQAANPQHQSGVVFFPGSVPLYHGSNLAGGLGVSGDGVDQDDYVTFLGAQGFLPPQSLWADNVSIGGVRLPFLKFPRNPEQ